MLRIVNISKSYKKEMVYDGANLKLNTEDGMILLWGPSGSGKTTLINLIMGYEPLDLGQIKINDHLLTSEISQNDISLVKQDLCLFQNLTLLENLYLSGDSGAEINAYLKKFQMEKHAHKKIKNLSGGQKQRVAIIRALLKKPKILICDEPTNGLDEYNFSAFIETINTIKNEGTLVIIASHEQRLKEQCDTLVELKKKKLIKIVKNESLDRIVMKQTINSKIEINFKKFLLLIKNQKIEYFNKILLLTVLSLFFSFFSFIFFANADEYKKTFFNGMSDQIVVMRNDRVYSPYGEDEKRGPLLTKPDRLHWRPKDVESVQNIDGVNAVYVGEENSHFVADTNGNTYTKSFELFDYKELFKDSIAINSAPDIITLSLEGVSVSHDVYEYYQGGNTRGMDIVYGEYPEDGTDQVLIPDFVAEFLKKNKKYENISDIVGKQIELSGKNSEEENALLTYDISGIYDSKTDESIDTNYKIYASYRNVDLDERALEFSSDFYDSEKSFYEEQGQEYLKYYEETYSSFETYSEAAGYFYDQMYIITDEKQTENVIAALKTLYPNNVIESQYTYKRDKELGGNTFDMIRDARISFIIGAAIIFSVIIFIIQKGYYLSKRKDYALLYSLGLRKKQVFKVMMLENCMDITIASLSVMIVTWILHYIPIRLFTKMFYFVYTMKFVFTLVIFLLLIHLLITLVNLKKLKYNKINQVLS